MAGARPTRFRKVRQRNFSSPMRTYHAYDVAMARAGYGDVSMLGDLFGDFMGAIVGKENWDARPDWMKSIKINADPVKIAQSAAKVVSPKEVGRVVDQAAKHGVNLGYKTPQGTVRVTGRMIAEGYENFPLIASMMKGFQSVPVWVYVGGAGLVIALIIAAKK